MGLVRFGFLSEILSRPLIRGFILAVALTIIVEQFDSMLGILLFSSHFILFYFISFHFISFHYIILYYIILYYIILYYIILYYIILYYIILYYIILYHIISYHIISYHIISYHIISYHIISYHIISYHIISYHIILYYILFLFFFDQLSGLKFHVAGWRKIPQVLKHLSQVQVCTSLFSISFLSSSLSIPIDQLSSPDRLLP